MTIWSRAGNLNILLAGWGVFLDHWLPLAILFVTVWGLGSWASATFFQIEKFPFIQKILIIINVGALVTVWLCFTVVLLGQLSSRILIAGSFVIPLLGMVCLLSSIVGKRIGFIFFENKTLSLVFVSLLFLFLLSRLAFAKHLLLPPYDDSPEHYAMILDLLHSQASSSGSSYSFANLSERYYHFGFHAIAAWLTLVANSNPAQIMILLGQVLLVFSSLSIFLLALTLTENISASLLVAMLAGFAWRMPAYAANWGKYPAIAGLALLPGWLALFILYRRFSSSKSPLLLIILGLGLIHTRIFVCMLILSIALWIISRFPQTFFSSKIGLALNVLAALLASLLFIKEISIYYSTGLFLPIGMVFLLLPFAAVVHPRILGVISLVMFGIWLASFTPVFFEGYGAYWLDAPFIELFLFFPFALYAGLGFSGLLQMFPGWMHQTRGLLLVPPLFIALVGFWTSGTFSPDVCCNYISQADLSAMTWISNNSSESAVIWVAGVKPKNYMLGTDGGVWVSTLTGRNMNKLRYDFSWESEAPPPKLCQSRYSDVYVYKGSQPYSFGSLELENAIWLQRVFEEDDVVIYQVACSPN